MGSEEMLGPVDYLVVEFPADKANFSGEMAAELTSLVDRGLIRVLDLVLLVKNEDGSVEAAELAQADEATVGGLLSLVGELATVLAEEDIEKFTEIIEPGSLAAVLVFENSWAAPFASSVRRSGRTTHRKRSDSRRRHCLLRWSPRSSWKESEMPLGPGRAGRPGVVGGPVTTNGRGCRHGRRRQARPRPARRSTRRWRRKLYRRLLRRPDGA